MVNMQYIGRFAREVTQGVLRDIKWLTYKNSFMQGFGPGVLSANIAPYMIPTTIRTIRESGYDVPEGVNTEAAGIGAIMGIIIGGTILIVGHPYAYGIAIESGHPYVLAAPVLTNLGSMIYENVRNAKKKLEAEKADE